MEFKNSFLSRLFGLKPAEPDKEEDALLDRPPESAPPPPKKPERHKLDLPQGHSLLRLRTLYSEQSGWQPLPNLTLEGPGESPLPEAEAQTELLRLKLLVNTSASKRFELLSAQRQEGEETAPPNLDAQVTVFLSKNSLTAWLLVYPPAGNGRQLARSDLDQALAAQGVCCGIDEELLNALPQDPERYFTLFPVARGTAAVNGSDGRVVDLFPRTEERKLTIDETGRVDYSDLHFIHNVEQGGVICHIVPPTNGIPGRTVQGAELPARDGKPVSAPKGRNTELSEDGTALISTIPGHVEFSGRSFQVKPVLDIPGNVDYSVGNINFLGDVCIHGDICSGFSVRAMGTITVDGVVEACTVEAGRDLIVARGVQGDNQAVIRAQRSIFAKYLENSCIYTKMDLETECIINCEVYCGGAVTVRTGHQSIIGGKVRAVHEVSAGVIGSRVGNRTDIILGGQPCEEFDYDLLTKEVQELEETMERTERQPDSPSKISHLGKLRMQLTVSRGKLDAINKDLLQQPAAPPEVDIRRMVCDTVFPGAVLTIDHAVYHFCDRLSPCVAMLRGDEIRLI